MATFNLTRNSRAFFTTNVNSTTGIIQSTGFTADNSQELSILEGFSFSQTSNVDTITVSEAGTTPARGQRTFNTQLNPVEFSFSTYLKPAYQDSVRAEEAVLWNAMFSTTSQTDTGTALTYVGAMTATIIGATATNPALLQITAGTAITLAASVAVGEYVILKGATGDKANELNGAYLVRSTTATVVELAFCIPPESLTGAVTANLPATSTATAPSLFLSKTAWNNYTGVSDTSGTVVGVNKVGGKYYGEVVSARSNANQLLPFGMVMTVDNITYALDNCALDQASIDFGLDGIATVQWTGKATALRQLATSATYTAAADSFLVPTSTTVSTLTTSPVVTFSATPGTAAAVGSVVKHGGDTLGIVAVALTNVATNVSLAASPTRALTTSALRTYIIQPITLGGGLTGFIAPKTAPAITGYITNKLNSLTLNSAFGGGGTNYTIPLTGGNITIANNINYVTPANIGIVNSPITYYTGTRSITGTLNAYLRTGTNSTSSLLSTLLSNAASATETKYEMALQIGGATNAVRVEILAPATSIQIPTIDAQSVLSTAINFTVQGYDGVASASASYDLEAVNDIRVRYFYS